ncbi:MAG: hypothetical protein U0640_02420 [Phycisphaerales bacterium]
MSRRITCSARRSFRGLSAAHLAVFAGIAVLGTSAQAQQIGSLWQGPVNGLFSVPGNWQNGIVPSVPGRYFVLMGGTAQLNLNVVVDKFGLLGGTLNVNNNQILGVRTRSDPINTDTGIFGGGTINLNSVGNGTYIRLYRHDAGAVNPYAIHGDINGPTPMNLSNSTANIIDGDVLGLKFINGGIISGSGQIGTNVLTLENQDVGVMQSTYAGGNLIIDAADGGFLNKGVLRAAGGTLTITGTTVTQQDAGEISVNSVSPSVVDVFASTIIGGRIQTSGSPAGTHYVQMRAGSVLEDVSIEGTVRVPNNNVLNVRNGITGTGSKIFLDSVGNGTYLRAINNATLNGQGGIECSNSLANIIDAAALELQFTNNLLGGIRGSAQIGTNTLRVVNNTFIESVGSQGIQIDPPATGFENNGIVRSTPNSPMLLMNGVFQNTLGRFEARNPSTFTISASTIISGELAGEQPAGVFNATSGTVLDSVTITPSTILNIPNNNIVNFANALTNQGIVSLNSVGNGTYFRTSTSNVTLSGGGLISMTNSLANVFDASVINQRLTNVDNTIRGSGQICTNVLQFVNGGTIEAQGNQGIQIDPPTAFGFENNGTVRALAGSFVTITSGPFDNADGLIEAASGGSVSMTSALMTGGLLRSLGTGFLNSGANNTLLNVTLDSNSVLNVPNNHVTLLQTTMTNRGTMRLNSQGNGTYLRTTGGDVVLNGGGVIEMTNSLANVFDASVINQRLTNMDNTIRGAGQIGTNVLQFVNNHIIEAQGNQGIQIDPPSEFGLENNGTLRALNGSSLTIVSGPCDNNDGVIEAADGGSVTMASSIVTGGHLRSQGAGFLNSSASNTLSNVTLDPASVLNVPNNNVTFIQGTMTNRGTFRLNSVGNGTYVRTSGAIVTLSGGGIIECSNSLANVFDASVINDRIINENNTIRGSLQIGTNLLSLTNRGSIVATTNQGIQIDPPTAGSFLNDTTGLLHAQGGNITIVPGPFSTAGTVIADVGRLIQRTGESWTQTAGLVLANGEIQVDIDQYLLQGGTLGGTGRVDSNVINSGGTLNPGASPGTLIIEGNYTQQAGGTMLVEINGAQPGEFDRVTVTGTAQLSGSLAVAHNFTPAIGQVFDILTATSRTGTFSTVNALGYDVLYLPDRVRLVFSGIPCDSIDFNNDSSLFDPQDIDAFLSVYSEGPCIPEGATCNDIDFNNDGSFFDPCDIDAFLLVFSEGPCTLCS